MKIIPKQNRSVEATAVAEAPKPQAEPKPELEGTPAQEQAVHPPAVTKEELNETVKTAVDELKAALFAELLRLTKTEPAAEPASAAALDKVREEIDALKKALNEVGASKAEPASTSALDKVREEVDALKKALNEAQASKANPGPVPGLDKVNGSVAALNTALAEAQRKMTEGLRKVEENAQRIARLAEEVAALKKAPSKSPIADPLPGGPPALPADTATDVPSFSLAPDVPLDPPKKVAITRKLWDYLNQTAIELPSRKPRPKP